LIILNQHHLARVLKEYAHYYNTLVLIRDLLSKLQFRFHGPGGARFIVTMFSAESVFIGDIGASVLSLSSSPSSSP